MPIRSHRCSWKSANPDYSAPLGADHKANPQYREFGFHYTPAQKDPNKANALAIWTADNGRDIVNLDFLKRDEAVPGWDVNQVKLRKTIVYNHDDPSVDLSNNQSTVVRKVVIKEHKPTITPDKVGYVFVRFMLDRPLPTGNITVTPTCGIGGRTDTIVFTKANQKHIIWEIFSDKSLAATAVTYTVQIAVTGPNFTDNPVQWGSTQPVKEPLPAGRIKYRNPVKVLLPAPATQAGTNTVNAYIHAAQMPVPVPV